MALNHRDQPPLDIPADGPRDGRTGANALHDPAHVGGSLPEATFPELLGRLINDVSELADRQIELAKQEIAGAKDEAIAAIKRIAIGAGIAAACGLLLVIWAWTAFIWFFNWLGAFVTIGPVTFAWIGWVLGLVVPAVVAFFAYRQFIRRGISQATAIWPPLPRTRETLKEDLEWVRQQRIPSTR